MVAGPSMTSASPEPVDLPVPAEGGMLEALLSSPFDPIVLLDAAGKLEAYNQAAEAELSLSEAVGWPATEVDGLKPVLAALRDAPEGNEAGALWLAPSSRAFLLLTNRTPDGGLLISMRDITDWRQLNVAQGDIMHVISHDLRTPLTAAKSLSEMLVESYFGELSVDQQTAAEKLALSIYGMVGLVDNLQDAGRFDPRTGFYKLDPAAVDLRDLTEKIVENHQLSAEIQHVILVLKIDPNLPIVMADRVMLQSALGNLLDNAVKFSPPSSTVEVALRSEGRSVVFSVRDQGPGIAAEDQERIFERNVRVLAPGQKRVRGSGLGLYIVQSVAKRHGGEAWVESKLDHGSTFFMRIPVRAAQGGR